MLKMVMLKTIFNPYCLEIIRNLIRPSPAGRTAPSIGLGFFLSVTATSAVRFFILWMLVGTVLVRFSRFFYAFVAVIVESRCIFTVSQSINKLCGLQ